MSAKITEHKYLPMIVSACSTTVLHFDRDLICGRYFFTRSEVLGFSKPAKIKSVKSSQSKTLPSHPLYWRSYDNIMMISFQEPAETKRFTLFQNSSGWFTANQIILIILSCFKPCPRCVVEVLVPSGNFTVLVINLR